MTRQNNIYRRFLTTILLLAGCCLLNAQTSRKLVGVPFGSPNVDYSTGSPSSTVNTPDCAFDGNYNTFYASLDRSNTWVGLDLGTPHVITMVGWCPRSGQPGRVQLGLFEGSNREDFLDAVPLYLIPETGAERQMSYADVRVTRGFRYVRYVGPNDARCNIGELEFYGYEGAGSDDLFYQVTNLPTLSIHTYTGQDITSKEYNQEANITITYDEGKRIQEYPILAKGRGNASWGFPKKPYRIKFNDGKSHHMLKDSPLESPAKAKKWTLINNYGDKTLMRNILAFEFSKRLGMPYTPYCQPVDVILNGEYRGCYQLCDQITIDPNRVNITEMEIEDIEEPELTGGYLVEVDAYAGQEKSMFTSSHGIPVTIKSPDEDDITIEQKTYIRKYFNLLESSLWSIKYTDEEVGYRSKLDLESFLRHFIVGEFSGNTDTYWSTYMYKDRLEDQFTIAPCWDFDLAFNNDNRIYPVNDRDNWVFRTGGSGANGMAAFVNRILSDEFANTRLKEIWKEMRDSKLFTKTTLLEFVDSIAMELEASQRLNFIRWPILNTRVHQNVVALGSYSAEVGVIRDYIPSRIEWIDEFLGYSDKKIYVDSTFYISTPEQLVEFAVAVNSGANASTGYLTEDIDMSSIGAEFIPIGSGKCPFKGTFDGRGHRIKNLAISGMSGVGVFGVVTGGAVITDFVFDSSCSITGTSYLGVVGMSSGSGNITLSRIGNEAPISGTGKNVAGILGCNMGSSAKFTFTDCYNTGTIIGERGESSSISGWAGTNATMENCWNCAEVTGLEGTNGLARGSVKFVNCYSTIGSQGTLITANQVSGGQLCYMLNGSSDIDVTWFQTLGEDAHPLQDISHGVVHYDETGGIYYNTKIILGDVNDDGDLTEDDIMAVTDYINGGSPSPFNASAADVNGDKQIDVADVVAICSAMQGRQPEGGVSTARLYSSTASVKADGTRKSTVWVNAGSKPSAYQVDIVLSEGLYVLESEFSFSALHGTSHRCFVTPLAKAEGYDDRLTAVRILSYSLQNETLSASLGTAFTYTLHADETFKGGTAELKDMVLSMQNASKATSADISYNITLAKTYVSEILIEPDMAYLEVGDTLSLTVGIMPELATDKSLKWTSEDESVASVTEDGVVKAIAVGETRLSAAALDGSNIKSYVSVIVVDDIDGIAGVRKDIDDDSDVFDLAGRRVGKVSDIGELRKVRPGIYIINGRKVAVR